MTAVEMAWLSSRPDRMNALSAVIKVSLVFSRRDGLHFDDHDEKQYIDPGRTVILLIGGYFTGQLAFVHSDNSLTSGESFCSRFLSGVFDRIALLCAAQQPTGRVPGSAPYTCCSNSREAVSMPSVRTCIAGHGR